MERLRSIVPFGNIAAFVQRITFCAGIDTNVWQREIKHLNHSGFEDLRTTIFLGSPEYFKHLHNTAYENCNLKFSVMLLKESLNLQTLQLHKTPSGKLSSLSLFGITAAEEDLIDTLLTRGPSLRDGDDVHLAGG